MRKLESLITFVLLLSAVELVASDRITTKRSDSGIEIRANLLGSSGRFVQNFSETDPNKNVVQTYSQTSDLTTKGYSLLIGYGRDYLRREQSSFLYLGFESQKWNDTYDSVYRAFVVGVEGGMGSSTVKLVYGGEFAFGSLDTGVGGLGYLNTFTAEPYIGLRLLSKYGLTFNIRVGARGYYVEEVELQNGANTLLSSNGAYTANAQIGLGYRFY